MTGNRIQRSSTPGFGRALYYPYIHVQDVNWLKAALLYWDAVRRIVPANYHREDQQEVRQAVAEGLLLDTDPDDYKERAEDRFRASVIPLVEASQDHPGARMLEQADALLTGDCARIRVEKMTQGLSDELRKRQLLHEHADGWLTLERSLGGLYMMCLAAEMAGRIQAPPVTDQPAFEVCGQYLLFGDASSATTTQPEAAGQVLVKLGLQLPGPSDLHGVSLSDIIRFSRARADERRRFRAAVQDLLQGVNQLEDFNAIEDYFAQKRTEVEAAISDHRRALDELGVSSVTSLLNVTCPALVVTGAVVLAAVNAAAGAALAVGGLTIGFVDWWANRRSQRRELMRSCPWHYCLSLEREFQARTELRT